jgi:hypothetical protein
MSVKSDVDEYVSEAVSRYIKMKENSLLEGEI